MKWGIGTRVVLSYVAGALSVLVAGALAIFGLSRIGQANEAITRKALPLLESSAEATDAMLRSRHALAQLLTETDSKRLDAIERQHAASMTEYERYLRAVLEGDQALGVEAAGAGSDTARTFHAADGVRGQYATEASALIKARREALELDAELEKVVARVADAHARLVAALEAQVERAEAVRRPAPRVEGDKGGDDIAAAQRQLRAALEARAIVWAEGRAVEATLHLGAERRSTAGQRTELERLRGELGKLGAELPREIVEEHASLVALVGGTSGLFDLADAESAKQTEARTRMERVEGLAADTSRLMAEGKKAAHAEVAVASENAKGVRSNVATLLYALTIVAFIAALLLGIVFSRAITGGMQKLLGLFERVAVGEIPDEAPVERRDEIGRLTEGVNSVVRYLRSQAEAARKLARGDVSVDAAPRSAEDAFGTAFAEMVTYLRETAEVAEHVAQGDLSASARPRGEGDRLNHALGSMVGNLRRLVQSVQEAAEQVSAASEQIASGAQASAQGAQHIASGAEKQAA
ncbi:MAG: HAMP domain-containing protein, partial [Polyangiaceae bacterium]|nr:HAMP domain-containing protein [Polyangiaceae bacterium]